MFVTSRARANPGTHATNRLSSKKTDTTKHNPPNYGDTVVLFFVLSKREKRERERERERES